MSYPVFTAEYHGTRNHIILFVQTNEDRSGKCFHATGTILMGIKFEVKDREYSLDAADHVPDTLVRVGTVMEEDMARFQEVCESVPPPAAQVGEFIAPPCRSCGVIVKHELTLSFLAYRTQWQAEGSFEAVAALRRVGPGGEGGVGRGGCAGAGDRSQRARFGEWSIGDEPRRQAWTGNGVLRTFTAELDLDVCEL